MDFFPGPERRQWSAVRGTTEELSCRLRLLVTAGALEQRRRLEVHSQESLQVLESSLLE